MPGECLLVPAGNVEATVACYERICDGNGSLRIASWLRAGGAVVEDRAELEWLP